MPANLKIGLPFLKVIVHACAHYNIFGVHLVEILALGGGLPTARHIHTTISRLWWNTTLWVVALLLLDTHTHTIIQVLVEMICSWWWLTYCSIHTIVEERLNFGGWEEWPLRYSLVLLWQQFGWYCCGNSLVGTVVSTVWLPDS